MNISSIIFCFIAGFLCCYLLLYIQRIRAERDYEKYLATHCQSCGSDLDQNGECSLLCSYYTEIHADSLRTLAVAIMKSDASEASCYFARELEIRAILVLDIQKDISFLQQELSKMQSAISEAEFLLSCLNENHLNLQEK